SRYYTGRGKAAVGKTLGLTLICFLVGAAHAQDRQFPAALGAGIPPLGPTAPRVRPPQRNFNTGYPIYCGGYDYAYPAAPSTPPVTNVVMFQAPPAAAPPPAPPI